LARATIIPLIVIKSGLCINSMIRSHPTARMMVSLTSRECSLSGRKEIQVNLFILEKPKRFVVQTSCSDISQRVNGTTQEFSVCRPNHGEDEIKTFVLYERLYIIVCNNSKSQRR
jgi:hypothetical protein